MWKVVQSHAGVATGMQHNGTTYPSLLLEKRSDAQKGQLDRLGQLERIDRRVIEWFLKQPHDFKRYVYMAVVPLGADEAWEETSNGDAFLREALRPENPEWGHKSFERYGNAFLNHRNKDPEKGFGDTPFMVYNDEMERVEGIWRLDRERAKRVGALDAINRIVRNGATEISMGTRVPYDVCFPAGARVLTRSGYQAIESLIPGQEVLTHTASWHPIERTFERQYSGDLATIKVQGVADPLEMTANHPVWVIRREQMRSCRGSVNGRGRRHTFIDDACATCGASAPKAEWVDASSIRPGDYVATARPESIVDADMTKAYLTGLYLGDGCMIWQGRGRDKQGEKYLQGLALTFNALEDTWADVVDELESYGFDGPVNYFDAHRNSVQVTVRDRIYAQWLLDHAGEGFDQKQVPTEIFSWDVESKKAFLAGLLDSDGSVDVKKGTSRLSVRNRNLTEGMQLVCASLGWGSAIHDETVTSEWMPEPQDISVLHLGAKYTRELATYSVRARKYSRDARGKDNCVVTSEGLWRPVKSVELSEYEGLVFNIGVATDETYTVSNVLVHNCSVCENKARHPQEYCIHPRNPGFGYIYPDGRKMRVFNPNPKFFDLSDVIVNAAPEALTLGLLGSDVAKALGVKTSSATYHVVPSAWLAAERWGLSPGELIVPAREKRSSMLQPVKLSELYKEIPALEAHILGPVQDAEIPLENHLKESALSMYELPQVTSSLASLGIVLRPREFARVKQATTQQPASTPALEDISKHWDDVEPESTMVDPALVDPFLALRFRDEVPYRSILNPHLLERIAHAPMDGRSMEAVRSDMYEAGYFPSPSRETEAKAYIAYIKSLMAYLGVLLRQVTAKYPDHEELMLGARSLTESGTHRNSGIGPEALAALPAAYLASVVGKRDPGLIAETTKTLHAPGIEHLFGGFISSETLT